MSTARIQPGAAALALAVVLLLAAVLALAAAPAPPASAAITADPGQARLLGPFLLAGQITSVAGVRGEHRGQTVARTWTFQPDCPIGACPTLRLIRERPGGTDRLTLTVKAPGVYTGAGRFYVPLRCGRRTYARGESVPFSVTVHVTAAELVGGADLATTVSATYISPARTNLTPCVAPRAHEAATYSGSLIGAP